MIRYLKKCIKPDHLGHLCSFCSNLPAVDKRSSSDVRLLKEYHRLFGKWFAHSPSTRYEVQDPLQNIWWRVSKVNSSYSLCSSYPSRLIVPCSISDDELKDASSSRARERLPVISWCNPGSGAVLARSSQPRLAKLKDMKIYVVDARPLTSALGNVMRGGGSESLYSHPNCEVSFLGIGNIHEMRSSLVSLRKYVDSHGSISSNGTPLAGSVVGNQRSIWSGGTPESMTNFSTMLGTWLSHIQNILAGASFIASKITKESASVLVHCSDGWDRTTQLVGLACLLLDPYYRTFNGFQALVEKDWLAFGHQFASRMGLPTIAEKGRPVYELPWNSNTSSSQSHESSPILLQWLECIAHLMRVYPFAFEFSSKFLVDFMDAVLSCRFGNFLCNSEREREEALVATSCPCIWKYLADLRMESTLHEHRNSLYDPEKHNGPIVPPPPALVPTLWPQFYLRWSCPLESLGGGLESQMVKEDMRLKSRTRELESVPAERRPQNISNSPKPITGRTIRTVGSNVKTED